MEKNVHPITIAKYDEFAKTTARMALLAQNGLGQHSVILGDPGIGKTQTMLQSLPWDAQIERVLDGQLALINPRIDLMDDLDAWLQMNDHEIQTHYYDQMARWVNMQAKCKEGESPKVSPEDHFRMFWLAMEEATMDGELDMDYLRIRWRELFAQTKQEVDRLRKGMNVKHAWISGGGSYRGLVEAIYKYRNVDTLVFDDYDLSLSSAFLPLFNRIFASNERRIVEHHTSKQHSERTELPKVFSVRFNAMVICNKFGRSNARSMSTTPQQDAVYSRVQFFVFRPVPSDTWEYAKTWFKDKKVIKWVDEKFKRGEVINIDLRDITKASQAWTHMENEGYALSILETAIKPHDIEYLTDDEEAIIYYLKSRNKTRFTSGEIAQNTGRFRGPQNKLRLRATISNLIEMKRVKPLEPRSALETKGRPEGSLFLFLSDEEVRKELVKANKPSKPNKPKGKVKA